MFNISFLRRSAHREDFREQTFLRAGHKGDLLPKLTRKDNSGMSNLAHTAAGGLLGLD